jgi:hypothetical protein
MASASANNRNNGISEIMASAKISASEMKYRKYQSASKYHGEMASSISA